MTASKDSYLKKHLVVSYEGNFFSFFSFCRCSVWIVFLLSLLGNGCVVIVLIASRSKMDVPRFLVCNLAMADFFMG